MERDIHRCTTCQATQFDRNEESNTCQYCGGYKEKILIQSNNKPTPVVINMIQFNNWKDAVKFYNSIKPTIKGF